MATNEVRKDVKAEAERIQKKYFTLFDVLIYFVLGFAIVALGLMNWADLSFDPSDIDASFVAHAIIQILSYGAIIASFTSKQLMKKKETDGEYNQLKREIQRILSRYRPDKLREYIYQENLRRKHEAFIHKYELKLEELESKNRTLEDDRIWHEYQKLLKAERKKPEEEREFIEPPNEYCKHKEMLLEKLRMSEELYEEDSVKYHDIVYGDLTETVSKDKSDKPPRQSESFDSAFGVGKNMIVMFFFSIINAGIILQTSESLIDAFIKTLITIFFALLSAFKGLWNGERVFENTTLAKVSFRRNHLYSYSVMEVTQYNFNVLSTEKNGSNTKEKKVGD